MRLVVQGLETFNDSAVGKVATNKQARFGRKGKVNTGTAVSVDMQQGLINKVAATQADVSDGLRHICPDQGVVYGDKGYCVKKSRQTVHSKGCHDQE